MSEECYICGRVNAYFICRKCNERVCARCYNFDAECCNFCIKAKHISKPQLVDVFSMIGGRFLVGFVLMFLGILLMTIAASFTMAGGEGVVIIFPFYIANVGPIMASAITILFVIATLAFMFLPWLLGSRRTARFAKKAVDISKAEVVEEGKTSYIITVELPGLKSRDDINIRVFGRVLHVYAKRRGGKPFLKTYEFPRELEIEKVNYDYESGFIIIRVLLRRKG